MIGPLIQKHAATEVEPIEPTQPHLKDTLERMSQFGVKYLYGRWLIEGAPRVILFDTQSCIGKLDEWKGDLWNVAHIPSPPNDFETNDAVLFGYLISWFLSEVIINSL
jgi:glycogen synthase